MEIGLHEIDVMGATSVKALAAGQKNAAMEKKMMEAAKDFESVFMAQMLKPMFEGIDVDPMFGGGHGEEVMRDLLLQEYGKAMASADNFGLSKAVFDVMLKIQNKDGGAPESAEG